MLKLTKIFLLLLVSANFAQSPLLPLMDDGISYEPETLTYLARVEADGGDVIDIDAVNDAYKNAKDNGYLDSLGFWYSANYGVKLVDGKISVLYSLVGDVDTDPTGQTAGVRCSLITNSFNNYATMRFEGGQQYKVNASYLPASKITIFVAYQNRTGTNGTFITNTSSGRLVQRNAQIFQNDNTSVFAINPTLNDNNLMELLFDYDAENYYCYLDGTLAGTDHTTTDALTTHFWLGFYASEFLTADVGDIIQSNTFLSSTKRTAIRNFLITKYGI